MAHENCSNTFKLPMFLLYRPVGSRGAMAPANLAYQLILSQPNQTVCAPHTTTCPLSFR